MSAQPFAFADETDERDGETDETRRVFAPLTRRRGGAGAHMGLNYVNYGRLR